MPYLIDGLTHLSIISVVAVIVGASFLGALIQSWGPRRRWPDEKVQADADPPQWLTDADQARWRTRRDQIVSDRARGWGAKHQELGAERSLFEWR